MGAHDTEGSCKEGVQGLSKKHSQLWTSGQREWRFLGNLNSIAHYVAYPVQICM